ncbi:MAG: putative cadmium-transporting ATPase [Chlamydiae bacterium]|nr:putative cadmium-transporting ATPase [Chlamydiota bacterium]
MDTITIKVQELDCSEECKILRKVYKEIEGIEELDFDVLNQKLHITFDPTLTTKEILLEKAKETGMHAQLEGGREPLPKATFWEQKGRLILCITSGAFLLLGFFLHLLGPEDFADIVGVEPNFARLPFELLALYAISIIAGGWFVFPKALVSAKKLSPDMNLLMLIAVIGAIALGLWFEAATVTFLFSLALLLESWSTERARRAISTLLDLSPKIASLLVDGKLIEKNVEEVELGVIVLVRPGERIPLDGIVTKGSSSVNQAPITGESIPLEKTVDSPLFAGTVNGDGALEFRVTKKAEDTTLARIIQMVQNARKKRASSEKWVDQFAKVYTPIMMTLALLVALIPPLFFQEPWADWIYRGLVLLVIACPCALVISTPVTIVSGLARAARNGVLIKGGLYLELAAKLEAIAFDKTGTVTEGRPKVQRIIPLNNHTEKELLEIAASLEKPSEHPLSRAILDKAEELNLSPTPAENFQVFKGLGAEGTIDGNRYWIGSHRFMHERKHSEDPNAHALAIELEDAGHSVIAIGDFTHICGLISVADEPREGIRKILEELHDAKVQQVVMLTGDNQKTAHYLAKEVGIDTYYAEMMPEDKVTKVEEIKKAHKIVAMVGDGVNDAPAMAASSFGIAMGAMGTDAAFETADIVLMEDDLSKLPWLIRHARRALRVVKQNIGFALSVKALFITLACFGLATLWMAIAADTGASLLVVFNGLRLLRNTD